MDLQTFLAQASPEEWHQIAWNWNWDYDIEPLRWIIRQPACDRGTALLIYWNNTPLGLTHHATMNDIPEYERNRYDLMLEIERTYLGGLYTRQEIAFDPRHDEGTDWTKEYADLPQYRPIPELMYTASPGRTLERDLNYIEGIPPEVDDEG